MGNGGKRSKSYSPFTFRFVAICLLLGALIGLVEIWTLEPSWMGFLAGIAAGAGFVLTFAVGWHVFRLRGRFGMALVTATAGAAAGMLWWLVMRSQGEPGGLAVAAAAGALVALFAVGLETRFQTDTGKVDT